MTSRDKPIPRNCEGRFIAQAIDAGRTGWLLVIVEFRKRIAWLRGRALLRTLADWGLLGLPASGAARLKGLLDLISKS